MRVRYLALAATLAVAAPLVAQQAMQIPGQKNAALVTAGTYTADPGHSLVEWTVDHLGFTPYFGIFGDVAGTLTLDPKNLSAAQVDVTIPVSKVTTASAGLTAHLLRAPKEAGGTADFFGAAPADARFVSTKVVASGTTAKVTGNLTLNGVIKPVTLDVSFYGAGKAPQQMGGGEQVGFEATGSIKRSEFNVGYGIPMVSDEVKLKIVAAFLKK
ncbi:YceI family protein [Sphingomonas sp. HF-S4]|uniref:YceI family protein n=1 Tax=Sphingomonas agrestis TaxID=3080540 RepID=A0ABU3Y714_9SPHN|nr:YceI family protein [Sphingomonas sp. HF-S4]MDV3457180.1 YceI family protein [Sphingomonas sp. HF-S4]